MTRGAVQAIEIGTRQGNWSTSANLTLTYTDDAQGTLLQRLFLKIVDIDLGDGEFFGDSDVTYYTRGYVDVKSTPLLRCYDAAYFKELNRYHLLLDDGSEAHIEAYDKNQPMITFLHLPKVLGFSMLAGGERLGWQKQTHVDMMRSTPRILSIVPILQRA